MTMSLLVCALLFPSILVRTDAKLGSHRELSHHSDIMERMHAFVFLGPTGDNALRENGVWQGLFESFAGGVYNKHNVGIHATMNTPHDDEELHDGVMSTLEPLYEKLQNTPGWECKQPSGDCDPERMYDLVQTNIWDGRDANAQAEDMIPALADYDLISVYLSIPPYAFAGWAQAAADNWGSERVHVAAEKPFGTSTEDADELYAGINEVLPSDSLQLVDHWLSFFMVRQLSPTSPSGACYDSRVDECNCNSLSCTQELCEDGMGLVWSDTCPFHCNTEKCDPLKGSRDDPVCTGPPELIDRFSKKMYRRKLIAREITLDDELGGTFCHLTFELCKGESSITHGVDAGQSDYYRIAASEELRKYTGTKKYRYSGLHGPTNARSYSNVNPFNEETLQFIIKKELDEYEDPSNECTPGKDCELGMSALVCEVPIGSDFLISAEPDIGTYAGPSSHEAMYSTIDLSPGLGPYTINVIGQGVALTELNVVGMSELLHPFASDGTFSTVKSFNYLWANSYWSSAQWVWEKLSPTDLARQFTTGMGKYGPRFNLMHAISREERPEAEYPRITSDVIGEAFNLKNCTQDPNIKWLVVGSSGFKRAMYPYIVDWGFDIYVLPDAGSKGYPYIGPNSLHMNVPAGGDTNARERSPLFKHFLNLQNNPR